jgi:hypothetical protein
MLAYVCITMVYTLVMYHTMAKLSRTFYGKMRELQKLVLIEWVDSHSGRGWQMLDELEDKAEPLYCRSVGWVVAETEGCKVIVPHIAGEENGDIMLQGCGDMAIPTKAIVKVTILRPYQA